MNEMQIVVAIFLSAAFPTTAALIGILLSRRESHDMRSEFRLDFKGIQEQVTLVRERLAALEAK